MRLDEETTTNKIPTQRGIRQGDTLSSKLFTLVLKNVVKELKRNQKGINVDGK